MRWPAIPFACQERSSGRAADEVRAMQDTSALSQAEQTSRVLLQISTRAFYRFQYGAVTLLVALGTFHYVYRYTYGEDLIWRLTSVFDPNREDSIPTAFSALNL